jgi:hypothetical protein
MTNRATGSFEVKMVPRPAEENVHDPSISRMSLDKQFSGDLTGSSKGQMLAVSTEVKNSAVYVALERFTGTLHGRTGSFALHHTGIMTRGNPQLSITVVPDSGTGDLVGLTGTLNIKIENGNHSHEFDYALGEAR